MKTYDIRVEVHQEERKVWLYWLGVQEYEFVSIEELQERYRKWAMDNLTGIKTIWVIVADLAEEDGFDGEVETEPKAYIEHDGQMIIAHIHSEKGGTEYGKRFDCGDQQFRVA